MVGTAPVLQRSTLRHAGAACTPPRPSCALRVFETLRVRRKYAAELRALVSRARRFIPDVGERVATLARAHPDAALETFASAFQRRHFGLDESAFDQGFEIWAEGASDVIPLLMRGTDRCNGIEPLGDRPGYTLQWALIEDVFVGDERAAVLAEVADAFGPALADRLESIQPPPHQVLCRRLTRSPYRGLVVFSRWALGDVISNPILYYHAHHADEVRIPWTARGVRRAARLVRAADDFQAPMFALARWLESAPAAHARRLVDAVIGLKHHQHWTKAAIGPCSRCGFPPQVENWQHAIAEDLLPETAHRRRRTSQTEAQP
jgi:hypothetical protein